MKREIGDKIDFDEKKNKEKRKKRKKGLLIGSALLVLRELSVENHNLYWFSVIG